MDKMVQINGKKPNRMKTNPAITKSLHVTSIKMLQSDWLMKCLIHDNHIMMMGLDTESNNQIKPLYLNKFRQLYI